jgi:hypothetical protein
MHAARFNAIVVRYFIADLLTPGRPIRLADVAVRVALLITAVRRGGCKAGIAALIVALRVGDIVTDRVVIAVIAVDGEVDVFADSLGTHFIHMGQATFETTRHTQIASAHRVARTRRRPQLPCLPAGRVVFPIPVKACGARCRRARGQ